MTSRWPNGSYEKLSLHDTTICVSVSDLIPPANKIENSSFTEDCNNSDVQFLPSCQHANSVSSGDNSPVVEYDNSLEHNLEIREQGLDIIEDNTCDSLLWDKNESSENCERINGVIKRKQDLFQGTEGYNRKKWRFPSSCCDLSMNDGKFGDDSSNTVSLYAVPSISDLKNWLTTFEKWTHSERLIALDYLIVTCELPQIRHMMQVIEPHFQRDFISLLPKEPCDLLRSAQTCRYWRLLAEDNILWREKCCEAGVHDLKEIMYRKRANSTSSSLWKIAYLHECAVEANWRTRAIKMPLVLKGHDDHVITCLQFSGNKIVSGSDDNTLKVWSSVTGKCLRTLVGHTGGVWSSQMDGNLIVSGSTDRTLKVWNAESGQCLHTLYGHTSTVRCMHLYGQYVVSGSRDATLRVWDVINGECLHVLVGHLAAVRCVQYDGRLVVSGAYDYTVKVWHPEKEECLYTLQGHTNRVYSLQFDGHYVVSGSLDTSIRVWEAETGLCKHTLMGHQSLTSGMELKDNILVSGNADSTVKVWDIRTGQCLQTLSGPNKHQSAVTCLQFNKKFVITSSDDGTVKLWDVKTGEFVRNLVTLGSGGSGGVVWRIKANHTKLVCAVGSRNGTEETKLLVLDFDS